MFEAGNELAINMFKVLGLSGLSFFLAMAFTPLLTRVMYTYKLWKEQSGKEALGGGEATIFNTLHNEAHTPRVGGVLIWGSVFIVALTFWLLSTYTTVPFFEKLNFVSRSQTWILLFTLIAASFLGLADDMLQIWASRKNRFTGGIDIWIRITMVTLIALVGAFWFYNKLGWQTIYAPGIGDIFLGYWYIPFFVITMLATFSGSVLDGIDGLSGGVLASAFAAYSGIAFFQSQYNVAAFAGVIVGAILAFLWFNIPPARFWMGESGMVGLTATLTVLAFFTDSVLLLPVIALPLVLASGSDIIQITSRKFFGKKVFLVAPIQHHFEAAGWPSHKVTMRFWVISVVFAILGMALALIGR
jgi:phospho-N-acetylmuramoyl-pentapeptide-transferase